MNTGANPCNIGSWTVNFVNWRLWVVISITFHFQYMPLALKYSMMRKLLGLYPLFCRACMLYTPLKKNAQMLSHNYTLTFPFCLQGAQLRKHIDATLGSGNLREAVRLPPGEDINEWLAVNSNALLFLFHLYLHLPCFIFSLRELLNVAVTWGLVLNHVGISDVSETQLFHWT